MSITVLYTQSKNNLHPLASWERFPFFSLDQAKERESHFQLLTYYPQCYTNLPVFLIYSNIHTGHLASNQLCNH